MKEDESDARMAERLELKLMLNLACLGVFSAEEFASRRQIVEERAHLDVSAGGLAAIPAVRGAHPLFA